MALQLNFEGYVNDVKHFDWGTVLKVSHAQRVKNEATGEWETAGYDYFDVTVTAEQLAAIGDNKIVTVSGTLRKGKSFQRKDGSWDIELKVRAQNISAVDRVNNTDTAVKNLQAVFGGQPAAAEDVPF
jgi:hypothetical protein